ncbi:MAG: hypothetical protein OXQ93_04705 [Gemmatimonadota bacterium]|nr:hypothetical protein [Gemmatimonadota bacterium]
MLTASLTIIYGSMMGCDPMGPGPDLRFGLDGQVRVTVEVPLQGGIGWQQQVLTWNSDGAWKLYEEIGYDSVLGDDNVMRNPGLPYLYAANYASLLQLAIDNAGTRLWEPPDQVDDCGIGRSRVSILIRDNRHDEEKEWARCAFYANSLGDLSTEGFEPDDGAARVIQIALRARDFTLGEDFDQYAYTGSLPFATIERGAQSGIEFAEGMLVYRSPEGADEGEEPDGWSAFWREHAGGERSPPEIDWARDMVAVASIGERDEAGHTVEVRRVLLIGDASRVTGSKIEMVELVPGDYCTPARRFEWPYHIVVTPRGHPQPSYSLRSVRVPCEA